ncbi:hypothetical protein [Romboutsia sp.]|uniref:hypothetical protein n=1 Tax=Romboutsia sp. TaxID=1965302 RepID=UPI003F3AEF14
MNKKINTMILSLVVSSLLITGCYTSKEPIIKTLAPYEVTQNTTSNYNQQTIDFNLGKDTVPIPGDRKVKFDLR